MPELLSTDRKVPSMSTGKKNGRNRLGQTMLGDKENSVNRQSTNLDIE